jgi:hypothetical protein
LVLFFHSSLHVLLRPVKVYILRFGKRCLKIPQITKSICAGSGLFGIISSGVKKLLFFVVDVSMPVCVLRYDRILYSDWNQCRLLCLQETFCEDLYWRTASKLHIELSFTPLSIIRISGLPWKRTPVKAMNHAANESPFTK